MTTKVDTRALPLPGLFSQVHLRDETYELGRHYAPNWDIHAIEADWRDWLRKKNIIPNRPDAHFLAFCKRRGQSSGFL